MRSANPQSSPEAPADNPSYEPSMEEILASIRRIIADDQAAPANGAASFSPVSGSPADDPGRDIAAVAGPEVAAPAKAAPETAGPNITGPNIAGPSIVEPEMAEPSAAEASVVEAGADYVSLEAGPEASAPFYAEHSEPVPHADAAHADAPPYEDDVSLSAYDLPMDAAAYAGAADVAEPGPDPFEEAAPLLSGSTDAAVASAFNMLAASRLADHSDEIMTLARDMIRPLLRSWIDDNLPGMVERMVRSEIERVARGGR